MYRQFSRAARTAEKRNIRRAYVFILASIAVLIFLIFWGFSLLAKLFVFIGEVKTKGDPQANKTDYISPGPPRLNVPFAATNSALFTLTGFTEPKAKVYLSVNDEKTMDIQVSDEGIFEFTDIELEFGKNTFKAVAADEAGNRSSLSATVAVEYSTTPPKLEVSAPTNNQIFTGKEARVTVKGLTDPEVRVTINDRVAIVGSDGSFQMQLGLNSGDNLLRVTATNTAGNKQAKEISVKYSP